MQIRAVPTESKVIHALGRCRNPLKHPAVAMRLRVILAVGDYRTCPGFKDCELWLNMFSRFGAGALANLASPLVLARIGPDHLSRRYRWT